MTPFYDEPDSDAAIDTVRHARETGIDFLGSSDAYGQGRNDYIHRVDPTIPIEDTMGR
jgi:aryl-alcohol dehydrogenase-like predicted oxidoreductase